MADLSITATSVIPGTAATKRSGYVASGVTVTAGQLLYKITAVGADKGKLALADANGVAPVNVVEGIALNGGSAGQLINYTDADVDLTIGATVAIGSVYIASATPGGIAPVADLTTGWFTTVVGVGISTTKIRFAATMIAGAARA